MSSIRCLSSVSSPASDSPWLAPETVEVVWFGGSDAERFLNDLISQEITGLGEGETRRSFLLSPQGKLNFVFRVTRHGDELGLIVEGGRGEELADALGRFRIRVDVDIRVGEAWLVMGTWDGYDLSWNGVARTAVVAGRPDLRVGALDEYERLRIGAGEPKWGVDVDADTIPHALGLVSSAVDFDKGCFLGQELVARMESRGASPPRIVRSLEFQGAEPAVGAHVTVDDSDVGVVTSVADGLGLASLSRNVEVGDVVVVGGVAAVVGPIPRNL